MQKLIFIILISITLNSYSKQLEIITVDKTKITVSLLDSASRAHYLKQYNGRQYNALRKKWTSRTYVLSDSKVIVEFYDKQAILIDNVSILKKLQEVRFVKNNIWNLKKNISYKIELTFEQGNEIVKNESPKRLKQFKSDSPEYFDFEVYELNTGQILYLDKSINFKSSTIYPDLKTLSSEREIIAEQYYGSEDEEYWMKKLASGDALLDFDPNEHFLYPKYLNDLIKNHKLSLVDSMVYVEEFYSSLYKSENGYYVLINEENQKNGAGDKMLILTLRIYENIQEVREAQRRYEKFKKEGVKSEHFYQKISDKYGKRFPDFVDSLVAELPILLNFDKDQLSFDSAGVELIDEALKWISTDQRVFDNWFPSVLAYYGQFYIINKKDGKWTTRLDKEYKVWVPQFVLSDGTLAFDSREFYKEMLEGPIPLFWIGGFNGSIKE